MYNIIGIGEVLWDVFLEGKQLGGAPANFAYHCNNLGADASIISAIGNDKLGEEITILLKEKNLPFFLNTIDKPTGTVTVDLKEGIPSYTINENVAWDYITLTQEAVIKLKQAEAVCFGSLAQRSPVTKNAIRKALSIVPENAQKVFDINLRLAYYSLKTIQESLELATILKLNEEELIVLRKFFHLDATPKVACTQLLQTFDLQLVAFTCGGESSMLITQEEISKIPTPKVKVIDTVGAGDAFTACMLMGLLEEKSLPMLHKAAVKYAAKVCMYKGAMPEM